MNPARGNAGNVIGTEESYASFGPKMAIDNVHVTTMAATPSHKRFKSTDPTTRKMAVLNQQFGLKGFNPD